MSRLKTIEIPNEFKNPLFVQDVNIEVSLNLLESLYASPFLFDILFALGKDEYAPWQDREETVGHQMSNWELNRSELKGFFDKRDRTKAKPLMVKSIAQFMMSLFWTNKKPVSALVNWESPVTALPIKPVNCVERLRYIISSPDHYHSYIQLTQLFGELNKQFQKSILLEKKSPRF